MKLLPLPLLMLLSPSALAGWTLPGFPAFDETAAGLFASQAALPKASCRCACIRITTAGSRPRR